MAKRKKPKANTLRAMLVTLIHGEQGTLNSLAKKLGISFSILWKIVNTETDIRLDTAQRLIDYFKIRIESPVGKVEAINDLESKPKRRRAKR